MSISEVARGAEHLVGHFSESIAIGSRKTPGQREES
jgi:hypothetical protein